MTTSLPCTRHRPKSPALAGIHKVSRPTVRHVMGTAALALLESQLKDFQKFRAEINEVLEQGGQLKRVTELLRWDETVQTLTLESELLSRQRLYSE